MHCLNLSLHESKSSCNEPSSEHTWLSHTSRSSSHLIAFADANLLTDRVSGQPFEYMSGFGAGSSPDQIIAKSVGKNGVVLYLYVDGHVSTGFEE